MILGMLFVMTYTSERYDCNYNSDEVAARAKILKKYYVCHDCLSLGRPAYKVVAHYSKAVLSDIDCQCNFTTVFDKATLQDDQDFCYALAWLRTQSDMPVIENSNTQYQTVSTTVRSRRQGSGAFMKACIAGDVHKVVQLAKVLSKKEINAQDAQGNTALMLACEKLQYDVVCALLRLRKNKQLLVDITIQDKEHFDVFDRLSNLVYDYKKYWKPGLTLRQYLDIVGNMKHLLDTHPQYHNTALFPQDKKYRIFHAACKHGMWYFAKIFLQNYSCDCFNRDCKNDLAMGMNGSDRTEPKIACDIMFTFYAEKYRDILQLETLEQKELAKAYRKCRHGNRHALYSVLVAEPMVLAKARMNHLTVRNIENIKKLFHVCYFLKTIQFMEYQYPGEKKYWDIYAQALTAALHKK